MPVFWHGKKVTQQVRKLMGDRLEKAARMLRNYARERSSRSQPTRGVGTLKRGLDPSKPGEYPKVVSGTHRRMITFEVDRKILVARVGSNLVYARYLELGTRKMKRRPWLTRGPGRIDGTVAEDSTMRELDEAIYRTWDQDSAFQALFPGGFHRGRHPTDDVFPYLIVEPGLSGPVEYTTGPQNCQDIFRLFHIWDTDDRNVEVLMEKVEELFIDIVPIMLHAVRNVMAGYIESTLIAEDPDKTGSGLTVWQGTINVRYLVQRR